MAVVVAVVVVEVGLVLDVVAAAEGSDLLIYRLCLCFSMRIQLFFDWLFEQADFFRRL